MGSGPAGRQPSRGLPVIQAPLAGGRGLQSPGSANGGGYAAGRASTGSARPAAGRGQTVAPVSTRSKLSQPSRRSDPNVNKINIISLVSVKKTNICFHFIARSLGVTKISDESWKDGCY